MRKLVLALLGVFIFAMPVLAVDSHETTADSGGDQYIEPVQGDMWAAPRDIIYDNGPLVNCEGCGAGGADESQLQSALGMTLYGFGHQHTLGYTMADDFTVPDGTQWSIDQITFFAYQTNAPTNPSPITGVYLAVFDGPPETGNLIYGGLNTNAMTSTAWSGIYRTIDTAPGTTARAIFADVCHLPTTLVLDPGTYWLVWNTDGNLASGPWAPPITISFVCETGNALQSLDGGVTFPPAIDTGSGCQQGMPFILEGGNPPPPVPVGTSSWGAIKATYH